MNRLALLLMPILLTACAAQQARDKWDARVGTWTYSQTIAELGLPMAKEQTQDGGFMAQWQETRTHVSPAYSYPVQAYNYQTGGYSTQYRTGGGGGRSRTERLLLTFDSGLILRSYSWSRR
jgi:hypothetical protein